MTVSVVLPVFNAENSVEESLRSIMLQTYSDLDILVIDDGSTDASLSIIQRLAKEDSRIRLVSRANRGLIDTLNEAIDMAQGHWLARMDADDIALPCRIESQLRTARKQKLDLVGAGHQCFGASEKVFEPATKHADICGKLYVWTNSFSHPTVLVKTSILKRNPYPIAAHGAEDMALWMKLSELSSEYGWKFGNHPKPLLKYRVHADQISQRISDVQRSTVKQLVSDAIFNLDCGFTSDDLELHYKAWQGSDAPWSPDEVLQYEAFLCLLSEKLAVKYGRTDVVFRFWKRFCRHIDRDSVTTGVRPGPKYLGAGFLERMKNSIK